MPAAAALVCCLFKAAYLVSALALLINGLFAFASPQLTDPSSSFCVLLGSLLVDLAEVLSRLSLPLRMGRDRGREMELERTGGGLFLGFRSRISSGGYFSCLERAGRPVSAAHYLPVPLDAWHGPAAAGRLQ